MCECTIVFVTLQPEINLCVYNIKGMVVPPQYLEHILCTPPPQ